MVFYANKVFQVLVSPLFQGFDHNKNAIFFYAFMGGTFILIY